MIGRKFVMAAVAVALAASTARAGTLLFGENTFKVVSFQNVFDAAGNLKPFGAPVAVGDHFVGIINVFSIDTGGTQHYFPGPTDQLSGVFAQKVTAILSPDPFDASVANPHIVLGVPTLSTFDVNGVAPGGTFNTGLVGNEVLSLYHDTGATVFTSASANVLALLSNVAVATDGAKWATWALNPGDYLYTHAPTVAQTNFAGITFGGLDISFNNTGVSQFNLVNDPNESEINANVMVWLENKLIANPQFVQVNPSSQWQFRGDDPAQLYAVPLPSSLLGGGALLGLLCAVRVMRQRRA